jgi:acyl-coenzyme A synthetase/AMP-(fatty) acid ligase
MPRPVHALESIHTIGEIPRTGLGKIIRDKLRETITA